MQPATFVPAARDGTTRARFGRRSGIRRLTLVHPVTTEDGFRIIVPLGEESQWARNVLAAGHCRLQVGDLVYELDEPALVDPGAVAEVLAPLRWVQAQLGFRWLLLHRFAAATGELEALDSSTELSPAPEPLTDAAAEDEPAEVAV